MGRRVGKRLTDIGAINEALRLRRGANATPCYWQVSHSWFHLHIEHQQFAGNIHLLCGDCERVEFDNRMINCDLEVTAVEHGYRVSDGSKLLVLCGIVILEYNVMPLFGTG